MRLGRVVNARVVTPEGVVVGGITYEVGESGEAGRIVSVDDATAEGFSAGHGSIADEDVLDAGGAWLVPGGIDPHVHFGGFGDIPIADDFLTGSRAAIAGGTTCVMDFCEPTDDESAEQVIGRRIADASRSCVDYAFHFVLSERYEELLRDRRLIEETHGIRDYKLFTTYPGSTLTERDLGRIFKRLAGDGSRTFLVHAEDDAVIRGMRELVGDTGDFQDLARTRPRDSEVGEATLLHGLAERHGVRVCVAHSTCEETVALLNAPVTSGAFELETCPHYLELTSDALAGPEGALFTMTPPLRAKADQDALWAGLLDGRVAMLSTDHCPYARSHKLGTTYQTVPCGVDGVQWRMVYAYAEGVVARGMDMTRFVDVTSANAARFYGMWPRKGAIAVGSDADFVLIDPAGETCLGLGTSKGAIDYSIYEGKVLPGAITRVVKGGALAFDGTDVLLSPGAGTFLRR